MRNSVETPQLLDLFGPDYAFYYLVQPYHEEFYLERRVILVTKIKNLKHCIQISTELKFPIVFAGASYQTLVLPIFCSSSLVPRSASSLKRLHFKELTFPFCCQ